MTLGRIGGIGRALRGADVLAPLERWVPRAVAPAPRGQVGAVVFGFGGPTIPWATVTSETMTDRSASGATAGRAAGRWTEAPWPTRPGAASAGNGLSDGAGSATTATTVAMAGSATSPDRRAVRTDVRAVASTDPAHRPSSATTRGTVTPKSRAAVTDGAVRLQGSGAAPARDRPRSTPQQPIDEGAPGRRRHAGGHAIGTHEVSPPGADVASSDALGVISRPDDGPRAVEWRRAPDGPGTTTRHGWDPGAAVVAAAIPGGALGELIERWGGATVSDPPAIDAALLDLGHGGPSIAPMVGVEQQRSNPEPTAPGDEQLLDVLDTALAELLRRDAERHGLGGLLP